jgi:hypothetical protein
MRLFRPADSGFFERALRERPGWSDPEKLIIVGVWILALAVVVFGVARGDGFGPDRSIALAYVLGAAWLARPSA